MHSFHYKLGALTFYILLVASLVGSIPASADEAQPTVQVLASPTAAEAQPTEAPPSEPTVELPPTSPPTIYVPPTETFRVIEMSTRVVTYAPAPPTSIPTQAEPTLGYDATPSIESSSEVVARNTPTPEEVATAITDIEVPLPVNTDVPATATATATTLLPTDTATTTPTVTVFPTEGPYWEPGLECSLEPGKVVVKLPVPYIHQVLDIGGANGNWACGPTSVAMVLAYYGKLEPWQDYLARLAATPTSQITNYELRITNSTSSGVSVPEAGKTRTSTPGAKALNSKSRGDTPSGTPRPGLSFAPYVTEEYTNDGFTYSATARDPSGQSVAGLYGTICPNGLADWSRMAFVLKQHGLSGRHIPVTLEGVAAALDRGHPVIIGNDLTAVGHIIVAIGYTDNGNLIVNDPYGNRFASGYGGTRGEGLYYAWNCAMSRNAYEVIGVYSPPTDSVVPGASPGYGAGPDRNETPWLVSLMAKIVPPTATPSPTAPPTASPTRVALRVAKLDTSVRAPGTAAATAVISGWTSEVAQQDFLGWGLFSMLSLAATFVGVTSFRKTRRTFVEVEEPRTTEIPRSAIGSEAVTTQAIAPEQAVVNVYNNEAAEQIFEPGFSPGRLGSLPLIVRRTLPLALSLLLLGMRVYKTSKGKEAVRTRITDEARQLMIRNL